MAGLLRRTINTITSALLAAAAIVTIPQAAFSQGAPRPAAAESGPACSFDPDDLVRGEGNRWRVKEGGWFSNNHVIAAEGCVEAEKMLRDNCRLTNPDAVTTEEMIWHTRGNVLVVECADATKKVGVYAAKSFVGAIKPSATGKDYFAPIPDNQRYGVGPGYYGYRRPPVICIGICPR